MKKSLKKMTSIFFFSLIDSRHIDKKVYLYIRYLKKLVKGYFEQNTCQVILLYLFYQHLVN